MNAISVLPENSTVQPDLEADATVAVLGLGYVGLPTALAFREADHQVIGIDVSDERIRRIRQRDVDLVTDDHARLGRALDEPDDFELTTEIAALRAADVVIVCVPTPVDEHLLPDLSLLRTACDQVLAMVQPGQLVMLTSTTYAGTTRDLLIDPLQRSGFTLGRDVSVAFSPERITPGCPPTPKATSRGSLAAPPRPAPPGPSASCGGSPGASTRCPPRKQPS